jgi:hypothetical protein
MVQQAVEKYESLEKAFKQVEGELAKQRAHVGKIRRDAIAHKHYHTDFVTNLWELKQECHPSQSFVFINAASKKDLEEWRMEWRMNPKNAGRPCPYKHSATNVVRQNTIGKYMQEIATIAEFDVPEHVKVSYQVGRSLCITRMAQEGVDQRENEAFARQNCGDNVNAGYQELGPEGRLKRMKAVGPQEEKIKELRQLMELKKDAKLTGIAKKEANMFDNLKKTPLKESAPKLKESKLKVVHIKLIRSSITTRGNVQRNDVPSKLPIRCR